MFLTPIASLVTVGIFYHIFCNFKPVDAGMVLGHFIKRYEPLFYDHQHLKDQHHRATRSPMDHFFFHFTAHKRHFRLRLKRDTTVFASDIVFESTDNTVHYDTSRAVTGFVEDVEDSSAEGVVTSSGLLDGVVRIGEEEFYIEPAEKYLSSPQQFHSVIYRLSDVRFPQDNFTCLSHLIHHRHHRHHHPTLHRTLDSKKYRHAKTRWHRFQAKLKNNFVQDTGADANMYSAIKSSTQQKLGFFSEQQFSPKTNSFPVYGVRSNRLSGSDAVRHRGPTENFSTNWRTGKMVKGHPSSEQRTYKAADAYYRWEDATADSKHIEDVLLETTYSYNFNYLDQYVKEEVFEERSSKRTKSHFVSEPEYKSVNVRNRVLNKSGGQGGNLRAGNSSTIVDNPILRLRDQITVNSSGSVSITSSTALPNSRKYNIPSDIRTFNGSTTVVNSDTKRKQSTVLLSLDRVPTGVGTSQSLDVRTVPDDSDRKRAPPYWRELDALHYTEDGRTGSSEPYGVRSIQRTQWNEDRGQRHVAVDRRKSTCLLYLQADHLFYQRMGSEEACIEAMTRHVQKVNSIYRTADFDQDGRPDNISFLIKRIKVHTRPDDTEYRFVGNYGVEKFLELFSEDDYDAFCLAYMFTYRDFEGGTLGLAWTGDLKNAGGVCEKNGHYRGSLKSLNTGIITLLNYGKHVPPVVSHVTLAHEIGHNFGSPHDPEDDLHCTPGGDYGNYIMFARATSGDKKNNNKFSPCSLRSINAVLNTKARSVKGCFTEPLDAVCGNEVVEGAEECDCGWEEDCHEPCCFPMRVSPPQDQPPCRLKPVAYCSPSQGPCCSHDCRLKYGTLCREDNGCRTSSYCDGQRAQCPPSTKKPNKTICSEEFVCYNGECTGSICMAYGLESCQCVRNYHDPLIRSCELCCKLPGDELSCRSSFEWNLAPYDVPDLYAKPGAPCDNYNGYCDVYQTCREIDPSGPLATLRKILMSPEGAAILRRWFAERWWGILLLLLAVIITVAILVRLLSRRNAKNFLSTILPGQKDFHFCHSRPSPRPRSSCLVTSASGTSNNLVKSSLASRPRISSAPENGWV